MPIIAGSALMAAAIRPAVVRRPQRVLDLTLLACLLVTAGQLVPLSSHARSVLSPSAAAIDRALLLDPPANGPDAAARSLSLDPVSTAHALNAMVTTMFGRKALWKGRRV